MGLLDSGVSILQKNEKMPEQLFFPIQTGNKFCANGIHSAVSAVFAHSTLPSPLSAVLEYPTLAHCSLGKGNQP